MILCGGLGGGTCLIIRSIASTGFKLVQCERFSAPDDAAAVAESLQLQEGNAAELWRDDTHRKIRDFERARQPAGFSNGGKLRPAPGAKPNGRNCSPRLKPCRRSDRPMISPSLIGGVVSAMAGP